MALLEAKPASSTTSVFKTGNLSIKCISVEPSNTTSPPKALLIVTPTIAGTYPILLFLHGTLLSNRSYTMLLEHISSHGFIIVAPQLYGIIPPSGHEEIKSVAAVRDWLSTDLQSLLPENVQANLLQLALAGHSRGGKTAFNLAVLDHSNATTAIRFSALIGIDPVAGPKKGSQIAPAILTYVPQSFELGIPVMVLGTDLGQRKKYAVLPPCAPEGVSHEEFFSECKPPCCHFVTKDYGHMDMLDDFSFDNIGASIGSLVCEGGKRPRGDMRRCVGGIVVAFLRAYLENNIRDLKTILDEPDISPVKLDPIKFIEA
ncbi:hypothetical protein L1049_000096 [Liquidambar formosana]|uniref:Chlorophyllase n=1 Tax=Liquidambar formosana TaxID=63359 RepID=A0AAP0R2D2_LIQFO